MERLKALHQEMVREKKAKKVFLMRMAVNGVLINQINFIVDIVITSHQLLQKINIHNGKMYILKKISPQKVALIELTSQWHRSIS